MNTLDDRLQGDDEKKKNTPIYFTTDSTLQTPEEHDKDRREDPTKDTTISVSNDDLHQTETDRVRSQLLDGPTDAEDNDQ